MKIVKTAYWLAHAMYSRYGIVHVPLLLIVGLLVSCVMSALRTMAINATFGSRHLVGEWFDQKACTSVRGERFCTVRYQCDQCNSSYSAGARYLESMDERFFWDQKTCVSFSNTNPPTALSSNSKSNLFCDRYFKESLTDGQQSVGYLFPGKYIVISEGHFFLWFSEAFLVSKSF